MIRVIVDSGIDQNLWIQENYTYDFLPLTMIVNNELYLDREELDLKELHTLMKEGTRATTSQASPGQIIEVLEKYRKAGDDVIYVCLWEALSGHYQMVSQLVEDYRKEYPEFNIEVIEHNCVTVVATTVTIQILEMVKAGYSFEEIVHQAQWNTEHIEAYLTVDDLDWLVKGGRLSKTAGFVGSTLNVKPIVSIGENKLVTIGAARGKKQLYKRLVKLAKEDTQDFKNQLICISHVAEEENAQMLEQIINKEIPEAQTMIFEFGAVIAAHIGIGGVAFSCLTMEPDTYILPEVFQKTV